LEESSGFGCRMINNGRNGAQRADFCAAARINIE
jgi:hypothetical protein